MGAVNNREDHAKTCMFGWHACRGVLSLNSNMCYLFTSADTKPTCHCYTMLMIVIPHATNYPHKFANYSCLN